MMSYPRRFCIATVALFMFFGTLTPVRAQNDQADPADLLSDFIHYVYVARPDLATASAEGLFESGISDADLYLLVDEEDLLERLEGALDRAMRIESLEEVAGQIERALSRGRLAMARDPEEIERHIRNLAGGARARLLGQEALDKAGEFAVPQLLEYVIRADNQELRSRCREMLVKIGRQAVTPLAVALPHLDPAAQESVCDILGQIGWEHAAPALFELAQNRDRPDATRQAAENAFARVSGASVETSAQLWLSLAEAYWAEAESLVAWPHEEENNFWEYHIGIGLGATPVPTVAFGEIMTMWCSANALAVEADSSAALSLWIASNFRRADQLGELMDPTYRSARRPEYYAMASGPNISQMVLGRALSTVDSRLARHSIETLASTAGGSSLWMSEDRATPLVSALDFPERRVRYDAALAFGQALPTNSFEGSDRVMPILATALSSGSERFAGVIASHEEDRQALAVNLRGMGFSVMPPRASLTAMRADLTEAIGVDLFVVMLNADTVPGVVASIHADHRLRATPVLVVVAPSEVPAVAELFDGVDKIKVVRTGLTASQIEAASEDLIRRTTGELITAEEADAYAVAALGVIREVALKNTGAFDVTDAEAALLDAMIMFDGDLRMMAAETLSWIGTSGAQQAILDAALGENDANAQVILLELVAGSARRYGSFANPGQVAQLLELVRTASGPRATSAATAYGALNLPTSNIVPFIIDR